MPRFPFPAVLLATLLPTVAVTQQTAPRQPTLAGQDAYAALQEIVAILEADPATDWSRVRLEDVRQHLVDMNEVVLRSTVRQRELAGGLEMEITGTGRTEQAIHHMVLAHARELDLMDEWRATAQEIPGGARLTVSAERPGDGATVARIRGLGFIGLLTAGAHHQAHHLALARGQGMGDHQH